MLSMRTRYDGWTIDDLDALPPDGVRRQLLDGVLVVTGARPVSHQRLVANLRKALSTTCPPDYAIAAGRWIRDGPRCAVIPDLVVITAEAGARNAEWLAPEEVVLAVEIVSPASLSIDRVLKPALYASAGIGGYWRIEPTENYRVHAYALGPRGVYAEAGEFDDVLRSDQPWPLDVDLNAVKPE
jgi:Uma2 family endonuclease